MPCLRTVFCLFCFAFLITHGCASTSSTTIQSAATQTAVASAGSNPSAEDENVTIAEMEPFIGKWKGVFEDLRTSTSSTTDSRGVELIVEMRSSKPSVTWSVNPTVGERGVYYVGGSWKLPAIFIKKEGVVFLDFTSARGNNLQFHLEGNELHGKATSASAYTRCILKKVSQ